MTPDINNSSSNNLKAIQNTDFVYIVASSGTGKTFTGDYLAVEHGFHHVDGDTPIKSSYLPQYKMIAHNIGKAFEYEKNDEDAPEELWKPYHDELARLSLEAASSGSEKVVLSFATHRRIVQDYFISRLVAGGVPRENITIVVLTMDLDVRLEGLYYRFQRQIPPGMTLSEFMRAHTDWSGEEDMTVSDFIDFFKNEENPFQIHPEGVIVDVTARGELSTLDALDRALNLGERKHTNATMKEIEALIKPIDIARDRQFVEKTNWEELMNKERRHSSEELNRRSSLISVQ